MTERQLPNLPYLYKLWKEDFDLDPLKPRNLNTGDDWEVYHQIKIRMIQRCDIDIWIVKNQFEFAIMLDAYQVDYLPYMNQHQFPLKIEFVSLDPVATRQRFQLKILQEPYPAENV